MQVRRAETDAKCGCWQPHERMSGECSGDGGGMDKVQETVRWQEDETVIIPD